MSGQLEQRNGEQAICLPILGSNQHPILTNEERAPLAALKGFISSVFYYKFPASVFLGPNSLSFGNRRGGCQRWLPTLSLCQLGSLSIWDMAFHPRSEEGLAILRDLDSFRGVLLNSIDLPVCSVWNIGEWVVKVTPGLSIAIITGNCIVVDSRAR